MKNAKTVVLCLSLVALTLLLLMGCGCFHRYEDATCTTAKTCVRCGKTEGEMLGHKWQDATCSAPSTCSTCKATKGEPLAHIWNAATCTTPKQCHLCKKTEGEVAEHQWVAASCTKSEYCKKCGTTQGQPKGHLAQPATCETASVCMRCNVVVNKMLGHDWSKATCTTPSKCTRCAKTTGNALGHDYRGYQCQRCYIENPDFVRFTQKGDNIYYKVLGVPNSAIAVKTVTYSVSGTTLYIDLTGQKTLDIWGKYNNDPSRCVWKLYNESGYIVATGEISTEDLVKGDRFQKQLVIKNIDSTSTYRLKFYDYELFD